MRLGWNTLRKLTVFFWDWGTVLLVSNFFWSGAPLLRQVAIVFFWLGLPPFLGALARRLYLRFFGWPHHAQALTSRPEFSLELSRLPKEQGKSKPLLLTCWLNAPPRGNPRRRTLRRPRAMRLFVLSPATPSSFSLWQRRSTCCNFPYYHVPIIQNGGIGSAGGAIRDEVNSDSNCRKCKAWRSAREPQAPDSKRGLRERYTIGCSLSQHFEHLFPLDESDDLLTGSILLLELESVALALVTGLEAPHAPQNASSQGDVLDEVAA